MFVAMTKKVKRVRKPKHIEDGEIADSDEEKEGQIKKDTEGENVELVNGMFHKPKPIQSFNNKYY